MITYRVFTVCLFSILRYSILPAQLTIHVTAVPPSTPEGASIYIAGNFNTWNPGNPSYQLTDNGDDTYSITFSPSAGLLEFKFTRGSWETVEGNANNAYIPNRTYNYNGTPSTLNLTIAGWENGIPHTATDNVQILDEDFYMPQLDRTRRIWIYLPPDYATSSKHYPVLYMQDGQNLFDAFYSFSGEWKIDESMNGLHEDGDYGAIVVGIDNGGTERINEYSPYYNPTYGGGDGEAYAAFIVNTLKPHIDSTFRTLSGRAHTAIAGSSMGANISMYAAAEYPEVFGKVGIFSPAFWFSDSTFSHVASKTFSDQFRVYFVAGQNESQTMIPKMMEMYDLLLDEGIASSNIRFLSEPDGAHSEWFWAREYPEAYEWLFRDLLLNSTSPEQKKTEVFPNPASGQLYIRSPYPDQFFHIYSLTGQQVVSGRISHAGVDISHLSDGIYFLKCQTVSGATDIIRFVKF